MTNYRGPNRNKRISTAVSAYQQWVEEYLEQNSYVTSLDIPKGVSAFLNDANYISVMPFIPSKLSEMINDSGFINIAPVISVNGFTGAVSLPIFSGSYLDLTNRPILFSGLYADLLGKPALFTGDYNDLLNKPVIPVVRKMETFSGVTDALGNFSVTYPTPYSLVPHVTPQLTAATASQVARITSSTVNGFTINVTNRASVTLLAIEVLLATTTPVASAAVSVSVLARS